MTNPISPLMPPARVSPPALPPEIQAALDRAQAASTGVEFVMTLERAYFGTTFEFTFRTQVPTDTMKIVGEFQRMAATAIEAQNQDIDLTMSLVVSFLDDMATGYTAPLIADLMRRKIVGLPDLVSLQAEVMERAGGRPFANASSSVSGFSESGESLTGGAPPEGATPPS